MDEMQCLRLIAAGTVRDLARMLRMEDTAGMTDDARRDFLRAHPTDEYIDPAVALLLKTETAIDAAIKRHPAP